MLLLLNLNKNTMIAQRFSFKRTALCLFAILFLFTASSGCQKKQDQNAGNAADSVRNVQTTTTTNNYTTEYPVYKTQSEKVLASNRDTIASFRERLNKANAKFRAALDSAEQALEKANADLQSRLESFKAEGQDTWMQFKNEFDRSMDTVRTNLQDLRGKFYRTKAED
jgi:hypothetical protein